MTRPKRNVTAEIKVLQAPEGFDFKFASAISYEVFGIRLPFIDHEPLEGPTQEEAESQATQKAQERCRTLAQIFNQILNQAIQELSVPDNNLESLPKHGENTPPT